MYKVLNRKSKGFRFVSLFTLVQILKKAKTVTIYRNGHFTSFIKKKNSPNNNPSLL